jgi:glucose/arabinose dehydrogenase
MALHPRTGELWTAEHGPRGGDELNRIQPGRNYGWPVITHGMNYDGTPITENTSAPGMEQPDHHWTPSIAVCGITFYTGEAFPGWRHNLFAGGLASQQLHRIRILDGKVVEDEIVLRGIGRIRDVATGPDGALYLVLNSPDRIVRLKPAGE